MQPGRTLGRSPGARLRRCRCSSRGPRCRSSFGSCLRTVYTYQLGVPLENILATNPYRTTIPLWPGREPLSLASADLVRDAAPEARVAHLDDGFDLVHGGRAEGRGCRRVALVGVWAATEGIVGNLRALRVADDDQL